ncbi:MAG: hypothetical protein ACOX5Y_01755 [Acholeplasmataceae bacterium]|jgi:hypothetical protein
MFKKLLIILNLFIISFALIACKRYNDTKITQGAYATDDGMSWVFLYGDNEFILNINMNADLRPKGKYTINKDKLTLKNENNISCTFIVDDEKKLVFKSGKLASDLIE